MGDFNFPENNWPEYTVVGSQYLLPVRFLDATQDSFLIQHVKCPTRHRSGQRFSLLDLIFTNNMVMIDHVLHMPPLGSIATMKY